MPSLYLSGRCVYVLLAKYFDDEDQPAMVPWRNSIIFIILKFCMSTFTIFSCKYFWTIAKCVVQDLCTVLFMSII